MYYKAKQQAMNNGRTYHLCAILWRNNTPVKIFANSNKTHPKCGREYKDGTIQHHMHAEMGVVRFAKRGDILEVMRWGRDGETMTMSKPCTYCMLQIKKSGISKVRYTNWDGVWETIRV